MKRQLSLVCVAAFVLTLASACLSEASAQKQILLDAGWRFRLAIPWI
jgi:ABC-type phosphate/phosphonate transport system substrate-binding protein